jgi:hypothetical protein
MFSTLILAYSWTKSPKTKSVLKENAGYHVIYWIVHWKQNTMGMFFYHSEDKKL